MAKGSDLNIELTSVLNIGKSIGSINDSIKAIEKSTRLRNVKIKATLDDKQIKKTLEDIKKKLTTELNLKTNLTKDVEKQIEQAQNKLKSKTTVKGSQFINLEVERQAFKEITSRIREIRKNVDELAKVDITTNKKGQMTGATLTYYNKELGQTVTETMGWTEVQKKLNGELVKTRAFETQGFKYTDDMAKARRETEKLAQSVKNLNLYKEKMLGGNGFQGELDIFAEKQKGRYDTNSLKNIRNEIEALNKNTPDLNNKVKQLNQQFSSLKQVASESGSVLVRALENAGKFLRFYLVGGFLVGIVGQLRTALDTLKEIDTELINIAKVTNYTNQEMKQLTQTAIDAGKEFGRTAQEYLSAVTEFSRAGMGKQSEEYAKLSLLLQNVGDVTSEVANETLIAANAGFQLGGSYEALMGIIDKFNLVSNQNATTVSKMSDAMKVGASVFNAAGLSIDETIALIGTATASTQRSGSEISRGWRTILMNIRQVADEEAEVTEESMKKAEKALNSIGIVVRDSPSSFRPMFEIIRDLGKEWNDLTEVEQSYVAESLAGKRQANILISTLQNWGMAEKQLQESLHSSGSALQENSIYMDSWIARSKQLSTSATDFWNNFINTDLIKDGISLLTKLIDTLNVLINNPLSSLIIQTTLLTASFKLLIFGFNALKASTIGTAVGVFALDVAQKGLIVTTQALTTTLLASPLFYLVAISAGVIGFIKLVDKLNVSLKEQKEAVTTLSSEVSGLQSEYNQLLNKSNRTEEEEKYLKLLVRELEVKKELLKYDTKNLVEDEYFSDENLSWSSGEDKINNNIKELNRLKNELEKAQNKLLTDTSSGSVKEKNKALEKQIKIIDGLKEKILETEGSLVTSAKSLKGYNDILENSDPRLVALYNSILAVIEATDNQNNSTNNSSESTDNATNSTDTYKISLIELQKTLSTSSKNISTINSALQEYNDTGQFNIDTIIELAEKYPQLLAVMGDEKAVRQELINIIESEQETSRQAYINMLQDSEAFYNAKILGNTTLVNELNDKYGIDLNNYKSLAKAKLEVESELMKQLASAWSKYYKAGKFTGKIIDGGRTIVGADGKEQYITSEMRSDLIKWHQESQRLAGAFDEIVSNSIKVDFSRIGLGSGKSKSSGSSSSSSKEKDIYITDKFAQSLDYLATQLRFSEGRLSKYNEASEEYRKELNQQIYLTKRKQELMHTEADSIRKQIANTKEGTEEYDKLKQELNGLSRSWWDAENSIDGFKKSIEASNKLIIEQREEVADTVIDKIKDVLKSEIDAIDEVLDKEQDRHDRKIKNLEKEQKEFNDAIDNQLKAIDKLNNTEDYNKNLSKAQQNKQDIQNKINILSLDNSPEGKARLAELQKELLDAQTEIDDMQLDRQRELRKDNLNDQKDAYDEDVENQKEALDEKFNDVKKSLDKQKSALKKQLNDEKSFAKLREDIVAGNLSAINTSFAGFEDLISDSSKGISKSLKRYLIDNLKDAKDLIDELDEKLGGDGNSNSKVPSGWTKSGSNYKKTMDGQVYAVSPEGYIYKNNNFITSDKYKYLPSQVLDVAKNRKAGYYAEGGLITHPVAIAGEAGKEALFNMPQLNSLFDMLRNPFKYHVPNVNTPAFAGASGGKISNYNLTLNIDSLNGNRESGKTVFNEIVTGLKKLGAM